MLRTAIVRLVELCTRYAWTVIVLSVALSSLSAVYAVRHFAVKTDVNNLFPPDLPWAERAYSFMAAFPQHECGLFGVFGHPNAAVLTYYGLFALQHRGQESAGIVTSNGPGSTFHLHKDIARH